jgi:hypothetical protein
MQNACSFFQQPKIKLNSTSQKIYIFSPIVAGTQCRAMICEGKKREKYLAIKKNPKLNHNTSACNAKALCLLQFAGVSFLYAFPRPNPLLARPHCLFIQHNAKRQNHCTWGARTSCPNQSPVIFYFFDEELHDSSLRIDKNTSQSLFKSGSANKLRDRSSIICFSFFFPLLKLFAVEGIGHEQSRCESVRTYSSRIFSTFDRCSLVC